MDWKSVLGSIAPTLATALGGPLAGAAVSFLSSKLGVPAEQIEQAVSGMTPADLVKMKEIDSDFKKFMADNGIKIDLAQIEVNKQEAQSTNWFIAGGRPFILWVCGIAFAYVALIEPIMRFSAKVIFGYTGVFPDIDTTMTLQVLLGLLGLSGMRSWEKSKNVQSNH